MLFEDIGFSCKKIVLMGVNSSFNKYTMTDDCYVSEFYPTCRYMCHSADGRSSSVQREEVVDYQPEIEPVPPLEGQYKPLTPLDRVSDPVSGHDPPSQTSTLSQSEDDIPMIQKLQQLNHK